MPVGERDELWSGELALKAARDAARCPSLVAYEEALSAEWRPRGPFASGGPRGQSSVKIAVFAASGTCPRTPSATG